MTELSLEEKCCAGCTCTDPHRSKPDASVDAQPEVNVQES